MPEAVGEAHRSSDVQLLGALVVRPAVEHSELHMLAEKQQPRQQLVLRYGSVRSEMECNQ